MRAIITPSILERDSSLAPDIMPVPELRTELPLNGNVLLTGASGFLGSFLLHTLLKQTGATVYCLVRGQDAAAGLERLKQGLGRYRLELSPMELKRVIAVIGDLEQPELGMNPQQYESLSGTIDTIYHNGALVNYLYPYSALKKANVTSVEDILRFAVTRQLKSVHYVSSMFVFSSNEHGDKEVIREDDHPQNSADITMGYGQSKCVAERMVRRAWERGIPATILRVGRISGDSRTGAFQEKDFLWGIIRTCLHIGCWPDLDIHMNISPVDYVSRSIVAIASRREAWGKAFHVLNPQTVSLAQIFGIIRELGYSMEQLPYEAWKLMVRDEKVSGPDPSHAMLVRTLDQMDLTHVNQKYDMSRTLSLLEATTPVCPPVDKELLQRYLHYFADTGFLKLPMIM